MCLLSSNPISNLGCLQSDVYTHLRTPSFADDVLATVLALYMHDKKQPLPSHEEVLICTPETTTEEVISYLGTVFLLNRAYRLVYLSTSLQVNPKRLYFVPGIRRSLDSQFPVYLCMKFSLVTFVV